jgi:hypothetical protein
MESIMNEFVLQPWVATVGLKMQSILLSGFRAPDAKTQFVKKCIRWHRSNCQVDADPFKQSYMQTVEMNQILINGAIDELEYLPVHYVHHLADSFRIAAIFHPSAPVRIPSFELHSLIATELFHFKPETDEEFLERHKDKRII